MKTKEIICEYTMISFATIIVAAAVYFFMIPANVSVGSISGLSLILSNFIPLSVSALTMILNVGLLVVGFILIGKDFGVKTVYTSILLPTVMWIFEHVFPNNVSVTGDQTLDTVCYCFVVSIGLAMLFNRNASSGGLDIVAKLMNKFLRFDLGKAMSMSGMAVALSSILVYDRKSVVLSILGTYFCGIVLDHFIFGTTIKKRICIISEKHQQILDFIINTLHSGASCYKAYGAYSGIERDEINIIVNKQEYKKLMDYIQKTDPDAFVTVYAVTEIMYKPKTVK
ncbi:MAG: YitT family protein [Eubacteriales bacterium]|nr:YitT family protein [Eubacteriales bacterium]